MHEFSFASQILESVERLAQQYPDSKVVRVRLCIGQMLGVEPTSLRFCLESLAVGTAMEESETEMTDCAGTELIIEEIEFDAPDSHA